jgi:hypothetical protein
MSTSNGGPFDDERILRDYATRLLSQAAQVMYWLDTVGNRQRKSKVLETALTHASHARWIANQLEPAMVSHFQATYGRPPDYVAYREQAVRRSLGDA